MAQMNFKITPRRFPKDDFVEQGAIIGSRRVRGF